MGQRIVQVDAFTAEPFAGNPAGVCLLESVRDEAWLAHVAREMNLSETAFLLPSGMGPAGWPVNRRIAGEEDGSGEVPEVRAGDYYLRWFTPEAEVDLCGHATLASAHVLFEDGHVRPGAEVRFHTRSGLLKATRQAEAASDASGTGGDVAGDSGPGWITLDFPAEPPRPVEPPAGLLQALGLAASEAVYVGLNRMDYLVEVGSEGEVRALRPDFGGLRRFPVRGVIVTSRAAGARYDFVSRFFAPAVGIDEDPVTGSAHCCLGPYWAERLGRTSLVGRQVSARGGTVKVSWEGERVRLSGQAVTVMRGELA